MSIEGIVLEHFIVLPNTGIKASTKSCLHHTFFLLDDSKQDAATTTDHRKRLIVMLKNIYIDISIK